MNRIEIVNRLALIVLVALFFTACDQEEFTEIDLAITGFSPVSGSIGEVVTISGSGFTSDVDVYFNGESALIISVTDSHLKVYVPQDAITGYISVVLESDSVVSGSVFTVTEEEAEA